MSDNLFIRGGLVLTMNPSLDIVENGCIEVRGGRIHSIGPDKAPPPGARVIDAKNCLVMPGLINGHTHVAMSLLRGVAEDLPLQRWLMEAIFPLERKFGNKEFVHLGARLSMAEMIRTGTTTFNDMYYFEHAVARAAHEMGMRAICGQTIVEISKVEDNVSHLVDELDEFLGIVREFPLVRPAIAPHSVYGVTPAVIKKIVDYCVSKKVPIHTHLAETQVEVDQCYAEFNMSPAQYCEQMGVFEVPVIAAHCVRLDRRDIELLGKYEVGVVHNPESNAKLGTGICPVPELIQAGAHVCFGTDGSASNNNLDLLQEADTGAKFQNYRVGPGKLLAKQVVKMLTYDAARALQWEKDIGSLEVGKAADIIAIDLNKPHATPFYDPYAHVVFSASGADVKHSVINGQVVLENGILKTVNETALLDEARIFGKKIQQSRTE